MTFLLPRPPGDSWVPWVPWLPPGCLLGASWVPPWCLLGASWVSPGCSLGAQMSPRCLPDVSQMLPNQFNLIQFNSIQIKSNQVKSNQFNFNQIKSNQIKSNQLKSFIAIKTSVWGLSLESYKYALFVFQTLFFLNKNHRRFFLLV